MNPNNQFSEEEFQAIERYLLGQLSEEEKLAFERELEKNPSLRSHTKELSLIFGEIEEQSLRAKLDQIHSKVGEATPSIPLPSATTFPWQKWAIAASISVVLMLSFWFWALRLFTEEKLYQTYYRPDPGLVTAMSSESSSYAFERAMVDYKSGNYQAALDRWELILAEKPQNDTLHYFIGHSLMALDETLLAISYWEKVTLDEQSVFRKDAFWYLGIAWLKEEDPEKAKLAIQQSQHPKANDLLEKIP